MLSYNVTYEIHYIGEFSMNTENQSFRAGVLVEIIISCVIMAIVGIIKCNEETTGYENKLVIKYHSPTQEYDREMVRNMINDSQVWTNFVCREMKMDKHGIEYRMTNPRR